jgi:two-component sensor histidine kinase
MEEYELSSEFMYDMVLATKKTYSKDLSEAISDYKVRNLEREQDLLLSQEKEKNDIYLKFGVAFLVLFIFAVILAILLARRTNVLALRNNENETLINEKDLLMQEIHHRVKNNFELVSALLELQSYNIENKEVKEKIHAGQARIKSLSLIHNKLYESNESTSVDMQQYIFELTTLILKAADLEDKVELRIHANNIHLDIDTTVPIGLIINELVTNSCKYAFKGQGEWGLEISIEMQADGDYLLTYLEHNVDALVKENTQVKSGLGKMLIQNLVKQLRGKVTSDFANGAYYQIWFKDKLSRKKSD